MDGQNNKKKTKHLIIAILLICSLFLIPNGLIRFCMMPLYPEAMAVLENYAAAIILLFALILTPLMLLLHHHAIIEKIKNLVIIARIGLGCMVWIFVFAVMEFLQ